MNIKKSTVILALAAVLLIGGAGGSFATYAALMGGKAVPVSTADYEKLQERYAKYDKLDQLSDVVKSSYYKDVDPDALMQGTYKGLFWGLDDLYSGYLTKEEYEAMMVNTSSEFQGIGITFSYNETNNLVVVSTMDDSPAQKAGLMTGDIILMIDDVPYMATEMNEAGSKMRGKPGTSVKLTILREGITQEYTIVRANIVKHTVKTEWLDGKIALIRISAFEDKTGEEFEKELRAVEMKDPKGMIIDLRNNGGGVVEAGRYIADLLLPECTVVYLEDNKGEREYLNSVSGEVQIPYVLLINEGTASTSEILAAAVKDNDGGKLVGAKTFGKGIVQSIIPLSDGSGDAIKITTRQYFSPNGNVIQGEGISPDYPVEIKDDDPTDYQLEKAMELLK